MTGDFILASGSPLRLKLLEQISFFPRLSVSPDVDETPFKREKPRNYVLRVSRSKAEKIREAYPGDNILASDTIAVVLNRIVQKLESEEKVRDYFKLYSGRNIRALSGVCFINKAGTVFQKVCETKIKFKCLGKKDLDDLIKYGDIFGCSGGIRMEGFCEGLVKSVNGSYSNILGLPLCEVRNILISNGVGK
ncbi:MAG: Maf family nucleotide pyrophosphatase [Rickettsiales bacterium]|jgi:septum formation protein|nr:Maf family nucleotide pyrophosphatase [Rickettsiales bacterium]